MNPRNPILAVVLLAGSSACSDYYATRSGNNQDTDAVPLADTDADIDTAAGGPSQLWTLEAQLQLSDGHIEASQAVVSVHDEATDELCDAAQGALSGVADLPSPDASIVAWWSTTLPSVGLSCRGVPQNVLVGIGELHPQLTAHFPRLGIEGSAVDTLNGAYISPDDGQTIWAFAIAGDADALAGQSAAALSRDDLDGAWEILPVYRLPLAD